MFFIILQQLGDFGLVRLGASGDRSHSIALTTTVFGTSAYMAPEAFRGDVSVKMDIFSYGVVSATKTVSNFYIKYKTTMEIIFVFCIPKPALACHMSWYS